MIEDIITENTKALKALLAAVEANTAALQSAPAPAEVTKAPSQSQEAKAPANKKAKTAEPKVVEPEPEPEPEPEESVTPTRVEAPTKVVDDTPNVPSKTVDPSQPEAGEHVDVDEVIAEINTLVKTALMNASDVDAKKEEWAAIRKGYNVERISELRGNPAALLQVLAKAKAF